MHNVHYNPNNSSHDTLQNNEGGIWLQELTGMRSGWNKPLIEGSKGNNESDGWCLENWNIEFSVCDQHEKYVFM